MRAVAACLLVLCYLAVSHAWTCKEFPGPYPTAQIDAGQGKVVATDINNYAYFLSGTAWHRLGSVALKHVSVGPAGIWGVDPSNRVYKFIAGNFLTSAGLNMQQVDAGGEGQVVGVLPSTYITHCLKSTIVSDYKGVGTLTWNSLSRSMTYYSCGPLFGCWGIDASDQIYFTQKITPTTCDVSGWQLVAGAAVMVEVATDGSVFVVNRGGLVYQRATHL